MGLPGPQAEYCPRDWFLDGEHLAATANIEAESEKSLDGALWFFFPPGFPAPEDAQLSRASRQGFVIFFPYPITMVNGVEERARKLWRVIQAKKLLRRVGELEMHGFPIKF